MNLREAHQQKSKAQPQGRPKVALFHIESG
jgi:hypothetical protein